MAYAALVSLAQNIDQILNQDQYTISVREKQQIMHIQEHVIFLQAFLDYALEKASKLEGRITVAANEAEDIIENFMCEQTRTRFGLIKPTARPSKCKLIHCLRGKPADRPSNFQSLKKVSDEIESIAGEAMEIKNGLRIEGVTLGDSPSDGSSSGIRPTGNNDMVGFDEDLMAIKTRLCGESSKLEVIPIFGMGGIGKTTLARNAYDDPLTIQRFDIRAWVSVSHDYSPQRILWGLLVSMKILNQEISDGSNQTEEQSDGSNQAEIQSEGTNQTKVKEKRELDKSSMQEKVYKSLKGRRYLIVIDDLWSTEAWDDIRNIFPDDNSGSRIILTTRLSDVAAYPDPSIPLHEMHFMDVDQSWHLLRKKVFADQYCPSVLENIGKEIARSCRGLPLAIVVIAGLLSTISKTRASWEEIPRNVSSAFATNNRQLEEILSLSYTHLPHHLRTCFLYMGGFPEDYDIRVSKLVKLWVAEGFLKPNGCDSLEEEAEEYLSDLIKRSLVLVTKRKSNGKIKSCSVHDLVRDLCIRKAQQEKFLVQAADRYVFLGTVKNLRRVSTAYSNLRFPHASSIRTILYFQRTGSSIGSSVSFRLLRVLNIENSDVCSLGARAFISLPDQLFELFHLRYLALDYPTKIRQAISNLRNLQTLVIHSRKTLRRFLCSLPLEIWKLPKLRHVVYFCIDHLPYVEGETSSALENLQTLSAVRNFVCTGRTLNMIPNLKKLELVFCGSGSTHQEYHLENLAYLHRLEILKFEIQPDFPSWEKLHPVFPRTLRKLTVSGWGLAWEDMTIIGSLPNLRVLKLRDFACSGNTWETNEGEFPELRFLLIDKSDLRHWTSESSHFPCLECLVLHRCTALREIPEGFGEIPTLELIEVDLGNRALVSSAKLIQEEQESWGNDGIQVRCVKTGYVIT